MKTTPLIITVDPMKGAIALTWEQAATLGITPGTVERRGALKTRGPWQIAVSYRALCVSGLRGEGNYSAFWEHTVYGTRTLTGLRQCGYAMEGQVSIKGKKYRGFTTADLFELPDGSLHSVAVIHACLGDKKAA